MKLSKIFIATCLIGSSVAFASSSYAETVNFIPKQDGKQYFECTASDTDATITLQTHNVDAQGMCPAGNVKVSGDVVNSHYFIVKDSGISPSMDVTASTGTVNCKNLSDADKDRNEFGSSSGFCLTSLKK